MEILKAEEFSAHYIAGLFTPQEVITLLEKLLVVSHIGNNEYFIPSVLVPSPQSRIVHPSELPIPSFAFYFEKGGPQVGVFCSQVSFLIRDCGWELLREDEEVVEVSRNCITFKVPGKNCPGKLALIDEISNYIEVRLFMPPTYPKLQEKMQHIRDTLSLAFNAATKVHNFTDEQPEHAFMCPEQSEKCSVEAHPATVDECQTLLTCTIKPASVFHPLTDLHKKWLPMSFGDQQSCQVPTLPLLYNFNTPAQVGTSFLKFGTLLLKDETGTQVKNIDHELRGNPESINERILHYWLQGRGLPVTWETLINTLRACSLNELANKIEASIST